MTVKMVLTSSSRAAISRRHFTGTLAAASLAGFGIVRAQDRSLRVGVLLPRSGVEASIGQDCHRGIEVAAGLLKELGLPPLTLVHADTESSVEVARSRAERLIGEGAQLLIGAYDSGQTSALAQVAEQKGVPLVINIAAAPAITEQGYRYVFRNFPTAAMILRDAFANQKEIFEASGVAPKTAVLMRVNDTYGGAMAGGIAQILPTAGLPYRIVDSVTYDPAARDLSVEVAKARGQGADMLLVAGRLHDATLITRELIKQRWSPAAVMSMGAGWYEDQYIASLGKYADGPVSFVPWYDPNKPMTKALRTAFNKAHPKISLSLNHVYSFEALLIAAEAFRHAGATDPQSLAAALRKTDIKDNVSIGPGIQFNEKGQNDKLGSAAVQLQGGQLRIVAPRNASDARAQLPMTPYAQRA